MSDETPRRTPDGDGPGGVLVRAGVIVFAVGAVSTLATVTPFLLGAEPLPTLGPLLSLLMVVGFLVAAAGVVRSVLARHGRPAGGRGGSAVRGAPEGRGGRGRSFG